MINNIGFLTRMKYSMPFILLLLMMLKSSVTSAAGFDCTKAKLVAEKIVCSSAIISRLDERLGSEYTRAVDADANPRNLIASQKKWLAEIRNQCTEEVCLLNAYTQRIAWLEGKVSKAAVSCDMSAQQLVGSWRRLRGGDFEEFAITVEGGKREFFSWLHHKPEFSGSWELKECAMHIANNQNRKLDFDYEIIGLKSNILYLKDLESGEKSSYQKVSK